jgi:hypothetical protein
MRGGGRQLAGNGGVGRRDFIGCMKKERGVGGFWQRDDVSQE